MSVVLNDQRWQVRASCRGPQIKVFFPPSHFERKSDRRERERRAKVICQTCVVQNDCLNYALQIGEQHGIWGGLNATERKELVPAIRHFTD